MSIIKAIKHVLGLSATPANNFVLDASADNGTMKLARGNGQDIMTVDAAGVVVFAQGAKMRPVVVAAYASANSGAVSSGVAAKVPLNGVDFDSHGCFNAANNRIIPKVAGWYRISGAVYAQGAGITNIVPQIKRNGVLGSTAEFIPLPSGTDIKMGVSAIMWFNGTTDYVELWGSITGSSGLKFWAGSVLDINLIYTD